MEKMKCPSCKKQLNIKGIQIPSNTSFGKCIYCGSIFDINRFLESVDDSKDKSKFNYRRSGSIIQLSLILSTYLILICLIGYLSFVLFANRIPENKRLPRSNEAQNEESNLSGNPKEIHHNNTITFNPDKFNALNDAISAVQGSMIVGISYPKLAELIQKVSAELLILKNRRNSKTEEAFLSYYQEILDAYLDGLYIAEQQLKMNAPSKSGKFHQEIELDHLDNDEKYHRIYRNALKYRIDIFERHNNVTKKTSCYVHSSQIQNIWRYADRGFALLLGYIRRMEDLIHTSIRGSTDSVPRKK